MLEPAQVPTYTVSGLPPVKCCVVLVNPFSERTKGGRKREARPALGRKPLLRKC